MGKRLHGADYPGDLSEPLAALSEGQWDLFVQVAEIYFIREKRQLPNQLIGGSAVVSRFLYFEACREKLSKIPKSVDEK